MSNHDLTIRIGESIERVKASFANALNARALGRNETVDEQAVRDAFDAAEAETLNSHGATADEQSVIKGAFRTARDGFIDELSRKSN